MTADTNRRLDEADERRAAWITAEELVDEVRARRAAARLASQTSSKAIGAAARAAENESAAVRALRNLVASITDGAGYRKHDDLATAVRIARAVLDGVEGPDVPSAVDG